MARLNHANVDLNEKMEVLLSSASWRITKPIRIVQNIFNASKLDHPSSNPAGSDRSR
jgi:hypothetical protein